ncbi:MAG: transcription termination/antitermination protein NusG [Bacteroidia bacterium]|nr:transcription termination/antitermination protein NusG [Bacteroidia bacterium]MCX7652266.1 transcription termination/antitermination protein NusG [Bacteroidia bacterium]MDW8416528.1 transcription termination/antitermination protein NusG [Bacteroidia bacterium]
MAWYALKVRATQEKKVSDRIRNELARLGIEYQVKDILVPAERVLEERKGAKKKERERVFLPGYLFLEVTAEEYLPELIQTLKGVPDVLYFVSPARGAPPMPMADHEITPILSRARSISTTSESDQTFEVGQLVRISEGPFSGFEGYVAEVYPEKQRIQVRVKIFNRETPVELPYSHAEKI